MEKRLYPVFRVRRLSRPGAPSGGGIGGVLASGWKWMNAAMQATSTAVPAVVTSKVNWDLGAFHLLRSGLGRLDR